MSERTLSVLDGSTFVIGDRRGDLRADEGREHGFFSEDTRFVSRWVLRVDAAPLELLGLDQDAHFAARFFLAPGVGPDEAAPCSVMRRRLVDHVWMEEVTVTNHRHAASEISKRMLCRGRADMHKTIGARCGNRRTERTNERQRDRMTRHTNRYGF